MPNSTVYTVMTAVNFWWGAYGLDEPPDSEYVWIYDNPDESGEALARIEVGSKQRLRDIDERGILPAMIQIIPPSPYLEREALERSVLFFCEKFLGIRAQKVVHLRFLSVEEAIGSYVDFTSDMYGQPKFSDERIREIAEKSDKSENDILKFVTRALQKKADE
ncbi:hypothetical protein [Saccharibacillus sacchari]|uniref:hypothetical protein n=1 Tax=Saccharibacillus sacchari TaxID=456493 RepID=UPI0004ADB1B9|nr:hypothetical protein [Saccharibacillus sacchari]